MIAIEKLKWLMHRKGQNYAKWFNWAKNTSDLYTKSLYMEWAKSEKDCLKELKKLKVLMQT